MCCSRAKAHPLEELGRDLVQVGDDTCVEDRLLLGWAHLLEFGGSHDLPGHRAILSPEQVSASRPRGVRVAFSQIVGSMSGSSSTTLWPRCGASLTDESGANLIADRRRIISAFRHAVRLGVVRLASSPQRQPSDSKATPGEHRNRTGLQVVAHRIEVRHNEACLVVNVDRVR
jgi:hypothetical protein